MVISGKERLAEFRRYCREVCQKVHSFAVSTQDQQAQLVLLAVGVTILTAGLQTGAWAQDELTEHTTNFNTVRLDEAIVAMLSYLEGSFGALVMLAAGIGAILSSAFGQYKAALSCLVVAVGSFILRSFMHTFFNLELDG